MLSLKFEDMRANLPPFHRSVLELRILFVSEWVISQVSGRVFGLALSARIASRSLRIYELRFGLKRLIHDDYLEIEHKLSCSIAFEVKFQRSKSLEKMGSVIRIKGVGCETCLLGLKMQFNYTTTFHT